MSGNSAFATMQRDYSIAMDVRSSPNGMGATTVTIKRRTRIPTGQGGTKNLDVLVADGVPLQYGVLSQRSLAQAEKQSGGKLVATVIAAFIIPAQLDGVAIDIDSTCLLIVKAWGTEKDKTFFVRGFDVGVGPNMEIIATAEE